MPRFWQISPGHVDQELWPEFHVEGIIAIGWEIRDLRDFSSRTELEEETDLGPHDVDSCWFFSHEIEENDIIVAKKGSSRQIYGIGRVASKDGKVYDHKEERSYYKHVIPVEWYVDFPTFFEIRELPREFVQWTVDNLSEERFYIIMNSILKEHPHLKVRFEEMMKIKEKIEEHTYTKMLELLQAKKQVILYGPPGTGKTWSAKKFVEEYYERNPPDIKELTISNDVAIPDIQGFSPESFDFLEKLKENNSKKWMDAHREEFRRFVDKPLRAIADVVGEHVKKIDAALETTPDALHTISRINKNIFGRQDIDLYHTHMWSAFYRKRVGDKRKDAQLFIVIDQNELRFGFGFGNHKEAKTIEERFKKNVAEEVDFLFETLDILKIIDDFDFRYHDEQGSRHLFEVKTKSQFLQWLEKDNIDIVKAYRPENIPQPGSDQAKEIILAFQLLYPAYLFATVDDPREKVEDYLEGAKNGDMENGRHNLVKFVTFHQSYSYEEFVEGIRPDLREGEEGEPKYKLSPGIFKNICVSADEDKENTYFLIIDEINRGNISKVFGELITLLEKDKRLGPGNLEQENTISVQLPYSKGPFVVPWNLYVIGTMNTADKSIALVDVALRRRFGFLEVPVDYSKVKPIEIRGILVRLPEILRSLNEKISILIDQDHQIGHSYLMNIEKDERGHTTEDEEVTIKNLKLAFYNEIFPLIQEYFYNDWEKIQSLLGKDFVRTVKSLEDAQNEIEDASQGIYQIEELDGEDFLHALNGLIEAGKSGD